MSGSIPPAGGVPQQPSPNPGTYPQHSAPTAHPMQYGYGAPQQTLIAPPPQPPARPKGLAIAAMIVGIVSLVLCATVFIGIAGGIAAVVLGIIAIAKSQSKGMSITGIVTGALAIIVAGVLVAGSIAFVGAFTESTRSTVEELDQLTEELESLAPEVDPEAVGESDSDDSGAAQPGESAGAEWTVIAEISGSADQQTDTIELTGGNVRITYEFVDSTGHGMIVGAIYLLDEGVDIMVDGGIPDVMVTEAGEGETILRKGAGEYYLRINSANASYVVIVEELR